jgi:hypothetical protein
VARSEIGNCTSKQTKKLSMELLQERKWDFLNLLTGRKEVVKVDIYAPYME